MISFAREIPRTGAVVDRRLYLVILAAIAIVQLARVLGNSCRMFVFMVEETANNFLPANWWMAIDLRSAFWLVAAPLLAFVVVRHASSPRLITIGTHLALLMTGLLISGTAVNRVAYAQALEREQIRVRSPANRESAAQERPSPSQRPGPSKVQLLKAYQDDSSYPTFGTRYWVGETLIGLTDYTMMALVGYAVLYFRLSEQRARQAERLRGIVVQSRHDALCSRLTHHFLFNTLNMISSLTLTNGRAARTCIGQLGDLLRASVDSLPQGEVRLTDELRTLEIYLSLQQTRFGDNLAYSIDIDPGLEQVKVPSFLLQPLVENSFEHGFRGQSGLARVWVVARREGQGCLLEVRDNGANLSAELGFDERYGLGVTRERLNLQYGPAASVQLESNEPSGLRTSIFIPCDLDDDLNGNRQ